jgi:hypothetical protein
LIKINTRFGQPYGLPSRGSTINDLINKFEENGSVLDIVKSGRPQSITGQATKDEVFFHFNK